MKLQKLDDLAKDLSERIKDDKANIFKTKVVIVPSNKLASYYKAYYLKNNDTVLMNVKFINIKQGLLSLFDTNLNLATREDITNFVLKYLANNEVESLKTYLDKNQADYGIKLFDAAKELTNLFMQYEEDLKIDCLEEGKKNIYKAVIDELQAANLTTLYQLNTNTKMLNKGEIYFFGFFAYSKLEQDIINKYKQIGVATEFNLEYKSEKTKKMKIKAAPNKLREIEELHSQICKILVEENVTYSDFLVVGTNLDEYENTIARVFNQDGVEFPNLPYCIKSSKMVNNNAYNAMRLLKEIVNKGFYSRLDFDNLINNNAIKKSYNILDEDINNFERTLIDTNTYRGSDFSYIRKRLLISKICDINDEDTILNVEGKDYIPYTRIGLNDDAIVKFIKLSDDLDNLIKVFSDNKIINENNYEEIKKAFDEILSVKDENQIETNSSYKFITKTFEFLHNNNIYNYPLDTMLAVLIDSAKRSISGEGEIYSSGISFVEFDANTVLSAKYIFFINTSANNLPIKKTRNAFDINGLIDYKQERLAFNLYFTNCEKFFVSFVITNLKSGEDYFLSDFVKSLDDEILTLDEYLDKDKKFDEKLLPRVSLDENRSWKEIYTKRGSNNRVYYEKLLSKKEPRDQIPISPLVSKNITTSELGSFLDEPLQSKANRLFGFEDETDKKINEEYEPFALNNLDNAIIFKEIFKKLTDNDELDEEKFIDKLKKEFSLSKRVPNITADIETSIIKSLVTSANKLKQSLDEIGNYKVLTLDDLIIDDVTISNNSEFIRIIDGNNRTYQAIKAKEPKYKDIFTLYIISLVDVCQSKGDNLSTIILPEDNKIIKTFEINPNTARDKLKEIIVAFNDYSKEENKFFDSSLLKETFDNKYADLSDLVSGFHDDNGFWSFFAFKKLFDKYNDLGYGEDSYLKNIKEYQEKMRKLLLCFDNNFDNKKEEGSQDED